MRSHALYFPALVVATLGAAVVALSAFVHALRTVVVYPMTLIAGGMSIVLFLRMLFNPHCRRGINAANAELRGGRSWPSTRSVGFLDPEWGIFGSRYGNRFLQAVRAILFFEFVVAMVLTGKGRTDLLFLAAASFAVAMLLAIIHVGLNTQPQS